MEHLIWWGAYDQRWEGIIVPDAMSHPAKMARGLVTRIVAEGLRRGWWRVQGYDEVTDALRESLQEELDNGLFQRLE